MRRSPRLRDSAGSIGSVPRSAGNPWPVLVCLLGDFRLLKLGSPVTTRHAAKTETLLASLALAEGHSASRDFLLELLWPDVDCRLAGQSLNSLVYFLRRQLSDDLGGAAPVVHLDGHYRLNVEAGIGIDVDWFCTLVDEGERHQKAGEAGQAVELFRQAADLYRGDLSAGGDVRSLVRREHLRARFLSVLSRLADQSFTESDYSACLDYTRRLLSTEPCREDAYRLRMRCFVRCGERAQALRQYQLCESVLRAEFDVEPEDATVELYDVIRKAPGRV